MPSSNTSARLAPLAPTPRIDTPMVVGLEVLLPERRKRLKPGTWRRTSSSANAPDCVKSCWLITLTLAVELLSTTGVRAVTVMLFPTWATGSTRLSSP